MMTRLPGLQAYLKDPEKGFSKTEGWMHHTDVVLFDHLLNNQLWSSIRGDILEIGCYQGKSAIVLGYGLRKDESLVVNDLFEEKCADVPSEGLEVYAGLTRHSFEANYQKWHSRAPVTFGCPSNRLAEFLEDRAPFRFIHVDGGHAYDVVAMDIATAYAFAAAQMPIIVIDDYRTAHTPGVAAAAWAAVGQRLLTPFALTETKMYTTVGREAQQFYQGVVSSVPLAREEHVIRGHNVLRLWE